MYPNHEGSQRDYIYYNITPSNPTGTLVDNFKESVTGFRFADYALQQALNYINNASIDNLRFPSNYGVSYPWTAGQLNFRLDVTDFLLGNVESAFIMEKYFSAYPQELLEVSFTQKGNQFIPSVAGVKSLPLNIIPLMTWNKEHYSPVMKISVWKINPNATSVTITMTTPLTTVITYQLQDLHLGDAVVDYNEPAITRSSNVSNRVFYNLLDYTTGICAFNVIPVKQD
jgi:hypothetical protein